MKKIADLDNNFNVKTNIQKSDIKFFDVNSEPFIIDGVFYENGMFRRLSKKIAQNVSEGVYALSTNTAGGRVRFKTNSQYIVINARMSNIGKMPHFAITGSAGFDIYIDDYYYKTFVPPFEIENGYESVVDFPDSSMRQITINFPLYSNVNSIYIGINEKAEIYSPEPYKIQKPIVFYGSSITQGGCASHPGNSYQSIISRKLNANYINLGFSGNALGEKEIAEYISSLDMSAFVYDYDHNAPNIKHLADTHERMFNTIRSSQPNLPIIILSRPKYHLTEDEYKRLEIIKATYTKALSSGDSNVYFIDGHTLMQHAENDGTVDDCHPNDLGFYSMAKAIITVLSNIKL